MADPLSMSNVTQDLTKPTAQPVREFMGVPVPPSTPDTGYTIQVKRFSASGNNQPLVVHIPEGASPEAIRNNPLLLACVLKDGDPVWSQYEPGFVLVAALKAAGLGLDLLEGDIYPVEGRLGISDWAKIKYARSKGYRASCDITPGPPVSWEWNTRAAKGIWQGTDDTANVVVYDKNGTEVNRYSTKLKAWWVGHSKEWKDRTAESLRRKALARAYQEVCPVGVDPEEAPAIVLANPSVPQGEPWQKNEAAPPSAFGQAGAKAVGKP